MAEKNTGSLIGYDPLAWMNEKADERKISSKIPDSQRLSNSDSSSFIPAIEDSVEADQKSAANVFMGNPDADSESTPTGEQGTPGWRPEQTSENSGGTDIAVHTGQNPNLTAVVSNFVLEPVLNIRDVAALHERFLVALDSSDKIEIDASAVTVVDTATLQLLLILKRTAINLQKQVVIDFPSERFIEAGNLLGISEMLEVNQTFAGLF